MTAIPAASVKIKQLNENAIGDVFIQLLSEQDMPCWELPKGVQIHTVLSDDPQQLGSAVTQMALTTDKLAIWCAGVRANLRQ